MSNTPTSNLQRTVKRYRLGQIVTNAMAVIAGLLLIYCPALLVKLVVGPVSPGDLVGVVVGVLALRLWASIPGALRRYFGDLTSLRAAIDTCRDVASIPQLIELLPRQEEGVSRLAARSLCCLLPELDRTAATHLKSTHWHILNGHLHGDDVALILEILRLYGRLGDSRALGMVRRLASGPANTALEEAIRDEAGRTLVSLRSSLEHAGTQLLRASEAPPVPDTLLRATVQPSDLHQEELLRPSG